MVWSDESSYPTQGGRLTVLLDLSLPDTNLEEIKRMKREMRL